MDTSSATSADRRAAMEGFRTPVVDLGSMTMEALVQEYINMKLEEYQLGRESEHLNQCVESLREDSVRLQQRIEVEEERAANQLIRRLADVELDARHREAKLRDEEAATRALLEKISTVSSQRDEMEAQLAKEQHYLLDQLQTQLMVAAKKKSDLEQRLVHEGKRYLNVLLEKLQQIPRLSEDDTQRSTGISSERTTPLLPACEEEHITTTTTSVDPTTSSTADASHATTTTTKTEADKTATTTAQPVGSPTTRSILRLEKKLNHLLRSHDRTMLQRQRNEEECSQLTERLRRIQQDTFLEVAKSAKLKEEIELARQRLLALDQDDVSWEDTSTTASCCATPHHQPTLSGSLIGVPTLRDHTKEVLSSTGAGFGLT